MNNFELKFLQNICAYCVNNKKKKRCKNIQESNLKELLTYKCLNYRRKDIALKEFSEYIRYTYYDENGRNIAIVYKGIPKDILRQIKLKFDEVKDKER